MAGKSIDIQAIAERFKILIKSLGFENPREMSIAMGYERPDNLYNATNGDRMPGVPLLVDVSNVFENANINWVLTGKGKVLFDQQSNLLAEDQPGYFKKGMAMITMPEEELKTLKQTVRQLQTIFESAVLPGKLSLPTEDLLGKKKGQGNGGDTKGRNGNS
jgi:hypothetical protein